MTNGMSTGIAASTSAIQPNINDLAEGINCHISKFVDKRKLDGIVTSKDMLCCFKSIRTERDNQRQT